MVIDIDIDIDKIIDNLKTLCEHICINQFADNVLFFIVHAEKFTKYENFHVREKKLDEIFFTSKLLKADEVQSFLEYRFHNDSEICCADFLLYAANSKYTFVKLIIYNQYLPRNVNHDIVVQVPTPPLINAGEKFDMNWRHSKWFMFKLFLLSIRIRLTERFCRMRR